jgi:hypothetical protein
MRGSPLFRTAVVLLALLLLLPLLRGLTNPRSSATGLATPTPAALTPVRLTITSTSFPFRFAISQLGKIIWQGESGGSTSEKKLALPFPRDGIDLLVEASWPEKKEGAVRLEVAPNDRQPIARTLWGTGGVDDVLTFAPAP